MKKTVIIKKLGVRLLVVLWTVGQVATTVALAENAIPITVTKDNPKVTHAVATANVKATNKHAKMRGMMKMANPLIAAVVAGKLAKANMEDAADIAKVVATANPEAATEIASAVTIVNPEAANKIAEVVTAVNPTVAAAIERTVKEAISIAKTGSTGMGIIDNPGLPAEINISASQIVAVLIVQGQMEAISAIQIVQKAFPQEAINIAIAATLAAPWKAHAIAEMVVKNMGNVSVEKLVETILSVLVVAPELAREIIGTVSQSFPQLADRIEFLIKTTFENGFYSNLSWEERGDKAVGRDRNKLGPITTPETENSLGIAPTLTGGTISIGGGGGGGGQTSVSPSKGNGSQGTGQPSQPSQTPVSPSQTPVSPSR